MNSSEAEQECPGRLPGSGGHGVVHRGQPEPAARLVPARAARVDGAGAGVEPLVEHGGVRFEEDVQDFLAQLPPTRQMLEIAARFEPLPEHEVDVLGVVHDRVRQ
ncbi:hypothetical protein [Amycolatopsis jiangsuensis]|uniref:Uncharacterized protein n=1 Tax=Amycolatopsis jiangsuensis TaxID=1181879 RepID=A0A840IPH3_9PSEU|nr:hypothetical protein [Amycolatopsis jiangsuensis]MBB4684276.1 hypothetical protein [Amycolatopsis jiangsuensis]